MATPVYEIYIYEAKVGTTPFILGYAPFNLSVLGEAASASWPLAMLTEWNYLEFHQRVNSPWNHMIRLDLPLNSELGNQLRSIIDTDTIINIWRYDPDTDTKTMVYGGFNRTLVDQLTSAGTVILTLYGVGFLDLLKRRIVIPPEGESNVEKSGNAETIMKEFVDEQAVSPSDPNRVIPGLIIEADAGGGGSASYNARYTILLTVVEKIAEQGLIDFGIEQLGLAVGNFIFKTKRPWGTDKRVGNLEGNLPLVLDASYGNMLIPILSKNTSEEITVAYAGGRGEGVDREIVVVENTPRVAASPWNRIERFVDQRREDTTAGLITAARNKLIEDGYRPTLVFSIANVPGSRWLVDWNLGDCFTARYFGYEFDKQITEISVVVTSGSAAGTAVSEVISIEMKDYVQFWTLGISGYSEIAETTLFG